MARIWASFITSGGKLMDKDGLIGQTVLLIIGILIFIGGTLKVIQMLAEAGTQ